MEKRANPKLSKEKDDFLRPWGPPLRSGMLIVPGWEGDDPLFPFILKVLRGKDGKMLREHLMLLLYHDFLKIPDMEGIWRAIHRPEILDYAVKGTVGTMRLATNLWIESGKSPTDPDVDTPTDRNVEVVLPGREGSLFQLMWHTLWRRFPQFTGMYRDGSQGIEKRWPRFEQDDLQWGLERGLEDYGARIALFYFADLLDSPDSRRIARCDHCKKHFAYERARLRTAKRGVFCPKCKGEASIKRTKASRSKRLDTAARAWIGSESMPSKRRESPEEWEQRRRKWVADELNNRHGTNFGRRWVSQNLSEIQERAEALRNAKS